MKCPSSLVFSDETYLIDRRPDSHLHYLTCSYNGLFEGGPETVTGECITSEGVQTEKEPQIECQFVPYMPPGGIMECRAQRYQLLTIKI